MVKLSLFVLYLIIISFSLFSQSKDDKVFYPVFSINSVYKNVKYVNNQNETFDFAGTSYADILYPSFFNFSAGSEFIRKGNKRLKMVSGVYLDLNSFKYLNIELDPNHYFGNHGDDGPYSFLDSTLARYSLLSINLPFSCKINLTRNGNISIFTGFSFDLGVYSLKKVIFSRIHQFYKDQPDDLTLSQNAHFYPIDNSHFNHKWNINYICKIRFNLSSKGEYDYSFTPNLKISLTNNYGYLGQPGKNYISGIVNLGHLTNFYFYSFGCEFSFWKKQL